MVTSYLNSGGSGDRRSQMNVTFNPSNLFSISNGIVTGKELVDGNIDGSNGKYLSFNYGLTSGNIVFDFYKLKKIEEITIFRSSNQSVGIWNWQGSNDGTNWTDIKTNINLNVVSPHVIPISNVTISYRYYRLLLVGGYTHSYPNLYEFNFKIAEYNVKYLIQDKSSVLYTFDSTPLLNILGNTLTEDLFKNKGFSDPTIIKNTNMNKKAFDGIDKGTLGTGKYFEFSLKDDIKTIKSIE